MDVRPDPLAEELQRLAPELLVTGGSFAHRLPEFHGVPRSDRDGIRLATSRKWTGECLTALLATVGLPAVEPPRLSSGARSWPQGYTGSVSKRRTKVVAAIAPIGRMRSIGVDIERQDGKGQRGRVMSDEGTRQTVLGERIREERKYRGLSQEEVARDLGVPRSVVSLIESGTRRVSAEELSQLARLYQTTMESLTGHENEAVEPESVRLLARATAELSPTDRDEVLRFAHFLQSRNSND